MESKDVWGIRIYGDYGCMESKWRVWMYGE